jgi:hypothetical protein
MDWKRSAPICAALIFGSALHVYRQYQKKGFLERIDIVSAAVGLIIGFAIFGVIRWWANKP